MTLKKILTGALIGAFVFGVSASNIQPVSAASANNGKTISQKHDRNNSGDVDGNQYRPEPPKDANGNLIAPPDRNSSGNNDGNQNRPEPPKDENGNPIAPPDRNGNNGSNDADQNRPAPPDRNNSGNNDGNQPPEPPKDENGNPLPPPDRNNSGNHSQRNK